jgi:hypothetical protein
MTLTMKIKAPSLTAGALVLLAFASICLVSCGRGKTEKLLLYKKWGVIDVKPPGGTFSIEASNRARDLKNGFYKNAWFKFLPDSIFIASFSGKADSGKYHISGDGQTISLYPKHGGKMYEQIEIRHLTTDQLTFNTAIADFHMTLHLKAASH